MALLLALLWPAADAHASCCMKKLLPYIPDPDATPPAVHLGVSRLINDPNPENVRPDDWDDDDEMEEFHASGTHGGTGLTAISKALIQGRLEL